MEDYHTFTTSTLPTRSELLKSALGLADQGLPVIPVGRNKKPLLKGWPEKATTDPRKITAWWHRWPTALIGVPTGERTGFLVIDVDEPEALAKLEAEIGPLPKTRTHRTGSHEGGLHLIFRYPDTGETFTNSSGGLPEGLDVRGEGGYVIWPPSFTEGPYEVLDDQDPTAPPEDLLAKLRDKPRTPEKHLDGPSGPIPVGDGPIAEGGRNNALARIAGKLHNGRRDIIELARDLRAVNEARCNPPLPVEEVDRIAQSIVTNYPPCKARAAKAPSPEMMEALGTLEAKLIDADEAGEWQGKGGKSERDGVIALLKKAREIGGTMIPGGLRVSISIREWALEAGVSKRAMLDYQRGGERKPGILTRLKMRGWVRSDTKGRRGGESGAIVLVLPPPREVSPLQPPPPIGGSGEHSRGPHKYPLSADRLHWSSPTVKPKRGTIEGTRKVRQGPPPEPRPGYKRLGKSCGAAIDALERLGGEATLAALADALGIDRPRDLRRRVLKKLEGAGVAECSGRHVSLTGDWSYALHNARELGGEIEAEAKARRDYERERQEYAKRFERLRVVQHPANFGADGWIEDLEPVPPEIVFPDRDQEERIVRLVEEGMSRAWAISEVLKVPLSEARKIGTLLGSERDSERQGEAA